MKTGAKIALGLGAALAAGGVYLLTRKVPAEQFECSFCSEVFPTLEALEQHIRDAHPTEPSFTCPYCYKAFFTEEERGQHIEDEHPTLPPPEKVYYLVPWRPYHYQKPTEGWFYLSKPRPGGSYMKPAPAPEIIERLRPYYMEQVPPGADAALARISGLEHLLEYEDTPLECLYCDARFWDPGELKAHIEIDHPLESLVAITDVVFKGAVECPVGTTSVLVPVFGVEWTTNNRYTIPTLLVEIIDHPDVLVGMNWSTGEGIYGPPTGSVWLSGRLGVTAPFLPGVYSHLVGLTFVLLFAPIGMVPEDAGLHAGEWTVRVTMLVNDPYLGTRQITFTKTITITDWFSPAIGVVDCAQLRVGGIEDP